MFRDMNNPCNQWVKKNILKQQYNEFCIVSYSFEDTDRCLLTSSTSEGPFYLKNSMIRKDVREDQYGVDLLLRLRVVDVKGCRPICGLAVDIWNSNACGVYSGFSGYENSSFAPGQSATPTDHKTFLRGRQFTDVNGMVEFLTIIPAWYHLRTPHIHIKIIDGLKEILTTQLFFPQELTYEIESLPPYNSRQLSPYINENDFVLTLSHGVQGGWPKFTKWGERIYTGTLTIGVDYGNTLIPSSKPYQR